MKISSWKRTVFILIVLFAGFCFCGVVLADHHKRGRHRDCGWNFSHRKNAKTGLSLSADNPIYQEKCGACHDAYSPELLPSASWGKILSDPDNHFGEQIEIGSDSQKTITQYLKENAAENSTSKLAKDIIKSLNGQTPLRITEVPYIKERHREISSDCSACHK
jgi:cytochrome c556